MADDDAFEQKHRLVLEVNPLPDADELLLLDVDAALARVQVAKNAYDSFVLRVLDANRAEAERRRRLSTAAAEAEAARDAAREQLAETAAALEQARAAVLAEEPLSDDTVQALAAAARAASEARAAAAASGAALETAAQALREHEAAVETARQHADAVAQRHAAVRTVEAQLLARRAAQRSPRLWSRRDDVAAEAAERAEAAQRAARRAARRVAAAHGAVLEYDRSDETAAAAAPASGASGGGGEEEEEREAAGEEGGGGGGEESDEEAAEQENTVRGLMRTFSAPAFFQPDSLLPDDVADAVAAAHSGAGDSLDGLVTRRDLLLIMQNERRRRAYDFAQNLVRMREEHERQAAEIRDIVEQLRARVTPRKRKAASYKV